MRPGYPTHSALSHGRRNPVRTIGFYAVGAIVLAAAKLSGRKHVTTYRIAELRDRHPDWYRQDLDELFRLLASGEISPPPVTLLPLARAAEAHERIAQGHMSSKHVLMCRPSRTPVDSAYR